MTAETQKHAQSTGAADIYWYNKRMKTGNCCSRRAFRRLLTFSRFPHIFIAAMTFAFLICGIAIDARAKLEPSEVLILENKDTGISGDVARMYQKLRGIPAANVLKLSLGTSRRMTSDQYWSQLVPPVRKFLEANPAIRCIVTTSGVPYFIDRSKNEGLALDNELAAVLVSDGKPHAFGAPNPLFLYGKNTYAVDDPRKLKMVYVARLDGPDIKTITRMVEDAVAVEKTGLQGPVYGDSQGLDGAAGYAAADSSLRAGIDRLSGAGFETKLDLMPATWMQPKEGIGNQAAGAAFYIGWYQLRNFQNIFGQQGLARGAIAWHIASGEAADIWSANEPGWCINLLKHGAAVTLGPVSEPFVTAFPRGEVFVETLLDGGTVAEAYWFSLPQISWNMVLLGDPLYRPWGIKPRAALTARAYVASNASHILEKGGTTSLMVQIECIGPPSVSTPALSATVTPEMGLAAASGTVSIPPLHPGQTALVRIPSVTAGNDATAGFRLSLNVQTEGETSRRIVLEGRTGFSRLTWGSLPKSQMFVSPNGDRLISGEPGRSMLLNTETLAPKFITPPTGYGLVGAEFSPDGNHVALAMLQPEQKKFGVILTDGQLGDVKNLPAGLQFQRWLENDKMLLVGPEGKLVVHDISGGPDQPLELPAGWAGTVIPGTNVQMLTNKQGTLAVKKGAEPLRELLQGTKATHFGAVADDLSLVGAVDDQRKLWVQNGIDGAPEVVATGVTKVLWGPISHRALIEDASGKSRVFDGRDRSWIDLGTVVAAQWSADEQRMLYVEREGDQQYLSILMGKETRRLCPLARIGSMTKAFIVANDEKAFLLTSMGGGLDAWMMALPPKTALENAAPFHSQKRYIVVH